MTAKNRFPCRECPASFSSPRELAAHANTHDRVAIALASLTGADKPNNGHALLSASGLAPARVEALDMLGEGWPTPALRFVVRQFHAPGMEPGTWREVRILQQLWHYGEEQRPVSRWQDVPTFEATDEAES